MSGDPMQEFASPQEIKRIQALPVWSQNLLEKARRHILALEQELSNLRDAIDSRHPDTEVHLSTNSEEVPLPPGSEVEFTIPGGGIVICVEDEALKLVGSTDLMIRPIGSFTLEITHRHP